MNKYLYVVTTNYWCYDINVEDGHSITNLERIFDDKDEAEKYAKQVQKILDGNSDLHATDRFKPYVVVEDWIYYEWNHGWEKDRAHVVES